ncbi:MAG: hypothetical protein ACXVBB_03685, partial [Isosphaeraceae bacterium]
MNHLRSADRIDFERFIVDTSHVRAVGGLHAGAARTTRHSGPNGGSSLISPGGGGVVSISPGFRLLPTSSG